MTRREKDVRRRLPSIRATAALRFVISFFIFILGVNDKHNNEYQSK
jgi:hypothetical protein